MLTAFDRERMEEPTENRGEILETGCLFFRTSFSGVLVELLLGSTGG